MAMKIEQLMNELEKLTIQAAELDKARGENITPLFDKSLFSCLSTTLTPCVKEAQHNLAALLKQQKEDKLTAEKMQHLCDKLLNQLCALQREILTVAIRTKEKQFKPKSKTDIHKLYQELAQHQTWERQLSNNVRIAEAKLASCQNIVQQQQGQKYLLAAESRLARCIEAKTNIERRIAFIERKG